MDRPRITEHAMRAIELTVGNLPAEHGGILGADRATGEITQHHFDVTGERTRAAFSPSEEARKTVPDAWFEGGVRWAGFVHSHPVGFRQPSGGDREYVETIFAVNPKLRAFELPLVMSKADTGRPCEIIWWRAVRDRGEVRFVHCEPEVVAGGERCQPALPAAAPAPSSFNVDIPMPTLTDEAFARVLTAYELPLLRFSRVICVGVGGVTGLLALLARAGLGHVVAIDHDAVSLANLATQDYFRQQIAVPKVRALRRTLQDVNPHLRVTPIAKRLEELSDEEFKALLDSPVHCADSAVRWNAGNLSLRGRVAVQPASTLLLGMTDSFEAQKRVNRLGLKFGIATLCAQLYSQGRATEISYVAPRGPTTACHRCLLHSRYEAYAGGFKNDVTSKGVSIMATAHLNAMCGHLALGLLHQGTAQEPFGSLIESMGRRNLIQIGMWLDPGLSAFRDVRSNDPRLAFGTPLAFQQGPRAGCSDCGGTGDLRAAAERWRDRDTRSENAGGGR